LENHHEWELRLLDRPRLTKADISKIVDFVESLRSSVELPPPSERRRIRREAGWTQTKVAKKIAVSRDAVGRWEKSGPGGRQPRADVASAYATLLDELHARVADRTRI
jgi:DNA-binding XRE family transcriptional regulator